MRELLKNGQIIKGKLGDYIIGDFLGSGGQGEVYEAHNSKGNFAIKWYFPQMATSEQAHIIKRLIAIGSPNSSFLWPLEYLKVENIKGSGYVMPLRNKRYKSIIDLMKRRSEPSFKTLIKAAIHMVDGFRILHEKGLCYRDISFGNIFFDDMLGDVLICDNDNVTFEDYQLKSVLGTPRFMAPEIVTGKCLPNIKSDLFSLAILLFYIFMVHHPLEGKLESQIKCFDLPAMRQLYGTQPLFIFHPYNRSNCPVKGLHDNAEIFWGIYPEKIKAAFTQSFTAGILSCEKRLTERNWLKVLSDLYNSLFYCPCGAENFYDIVVLQKYGKLSCCWSCKKPLALPSRIRINENVIALSLNQSLYPHQVGLSPKIDFSKSLAKVVAHPVKKGFFSLKNTTLKPWEITLNMRGAQEKKYVAPQKSIVLESGLQIDFGGVKAMIKR